MSSVWYCIPSKRPPEEAEPILREWRERGYKIALWRDEGDGHVTADWVMHGWEYPGYARAVNVLTKQVLEQAPSCEWIVTGGDDVLPDPNRSAEGIARECSTHFGRINGVYEVECLEFYQDPEVSARGILGRPNSTFGVMQPTGDRDWGDRRGPYCDFVAGSPWMGREWCLRINQGQGPLRPEYFHFGCDEELQAVAIKYGVFWQRQDLIHKHMNWGRPTKPGQRLVNVDEMPAFLRKANSTDEWMKYKKIFKERSEAGFPGSEPL